MILQAVVGGFVLDALFGDPAWLPHPVVLMGRCISRLEKFLRARLPGTPQGELLGGAVTAFCLPVGTFLVTSLVCLAAAKLSPWLGLAVQMFWCGQALAARGLAQESRNVYAQLIKNDLPAARKAVSRIVGRDTQDLTAAQPRSWTTLPTTSPAALLPFCGWPLRPLPATMPRAHGASGGGTGATTPAPTAPRPKAPAPVHWACSWPARLTILANITPSLPSVMPCAPLSRRTSCAPTA